MIHPFREGKDLIDEKDQAGRYFIREMVETKSGWIHYPWKNVTDPMPRMKIVRYLHFEPWDWIVAVGSYENEFLHEAEAIKGGRLDDDRPRLLRRLRGRRSWCSSPPARLPIRSAHDRGDPPGARRRD